MMLNRGFHNILKQRDIIGLSLSSIGFLFQVVSAARWNILTSANVGVGVGVPQIQNANTEYKYRIQIQYSNTEHKYRIQIQNILTSANVGVGVGVQGGY